MRKTHSGSRPSPFRQAPAGGRKLVLSRNFDSLRVTRNQKIGKKSPTAACFHTPGSRNARNTILDSFKISKKCRPASRSSIAASGAASNPVAPSLSPARLLSSKNKFRGWKKEIVEGQTCGVRMSEITPAKVKLKYSVQKIKIKGQLTKEAKNELRD